MKTCLLSLTALFTVMMVKAQTADEIIAKHLDALGGKETISKITSLYFESGAQLMGNESLTKTTIVPGKGYRNELDINGQTIVQVVTDKGGWSINPFAGASDATAMSDDDYKSYADAVFAPDPLLSYTANGGKVELQAQEKIGEVNAYKIKYTNKYGADIFFYIDPATNYIIQSVKKGTAMGQEVTVTTNYSNYQKTDFGVFVAYTTNIDMGQFAMEINTKKVEINKDIDSKIFEMSK